MANVGFGYYPNVDSKYAIRVSDSLDYEISFWFRQPTTSPCMEVSVDAFACDLKTILTPLDVTSGAYNRIILAGTEQICGQAYQWNFFHAIIYNKNQQVQNGAQAITSHAAGTNLIMRPGTANIFVNVWCVNYCLLIWDFKVRPLKTPFSTGFLGGNNLLEIFRRNNRKDFTTAQIDSIADRFLLPKSLPGSVIEI